MKSANILLGMSCLLPTLPTLADELASNGLDPTADQVELCDFKVPSIVARANATFYVLYRIHFDSTGKPDGIEKRENAFLEDRYFQDCFRRWRLPIRDETVVVIMKWEHGRGWVSVGINGPTIHRSISIAPGFGIYPAEGQNEAERAERSGR
jgi:hypothetical protein